MIPSRRAMRLHFVPILLTLVFAIAQAGAAPTDSTATPKQSLKKDKSARAPSLPPLKKSGQADVVIAQLIQGRPVSRSYPYALTTLLQTVNKLSTIEISPDPVIIQSFEDPALFRYPFIYVNFADRNDWTFSELEKKNLRAYLDRGGFIFVDAGITAEFLRSDVRLGQHHSFAEWDACPQLKDAFQTLYPDKTFHSLKRSHPLYRAFYRGLPDASRLPNTVRDFVVNEKWPQGTYSAVALTVNRHIAVLAMPIIAMGWGKNQLGQWATRISFRIRESASGLSERLRTAAYSGARFETVREDKLKDIIYCQREGGNRRVPTFSGDLGAAIPSTPAWVHEPGNKWRVFRYYQSREISDYAHEFYTHLGINILVYALTH